jgi:dienelactone hydrolase
MPFVKPETRIHSNRLTTDHLIDQYPIYSSPDHRLTDRPITLQPFSTLCSLLLTRGPMSPEIHSAQIDHIPAIWIEPAESQATRRLVIFLSGLTGTKENNISYLTALAQAGFVALSFDTWEHGVRTALTPQQVGARTFGDFRHYMWVNIGQTALETLRVIDWAIATLGVSDQVCMGGISMGGDISVAAAGIDPRIRRVAAVVATPDWLRPGMVTLFSPDHALMPVGSPDAYSRWFYEQLNPITHLAHYAHAPEIRFINGEKDDHVPPEAAFRFKAALAELYPQAAANVTIDLLPGLDHIGVGGASDQWWPDLCAWLATPANSSPSSRKGSPATLA